MKEIADKVLETLQREGLVQIEISARHVHLCTESLEMLFGRGATLTPKRELSQIGQYLAEERVDLVGPKGRKERVAVLGPLRSRTQVELSKSDCIALGVTAPVRQSGDTEGSGSITLEGPQGSLTIREGVIIAQSHVHMTPAAAARLGLRDKQRVAVAVFSERPLVYQNVVVRIGDQFRTRMHVDFDEANAALISGFTLGRILVQPQRART